MLPAGPGPCDGSNRVDDMVSVLVFFNAVIPAKSAEK
jgi:hypothetical protein